MQQLVAAPRDSLTEDQVKAVLTARSLDLDQFRAGLELLDTTLTVIDDITASLVLSGGDASEPEVEHNNYADVHGTFRATLRRALSWGAVLVRPYLILNVAGVDVRFNLGVYQLSEPTQTIGTDPALYDVQGEDLLSWAAQEIGDTWVAPAGALVVDEIARVLTAAGLPKVQVDRSATTTLQTDRTWLLQEGAPTFIGVANDLAQMCTYRGAYMSPDGVCICEPYIAPADRPSEFTIGATAAVDRLLADAGAQITTNLWSRPNWWRFVQTNHLDASGNTAAPTEGDGLYTVSDLTGQEILGGRLVRKVTWLDVPDQTSLEASANQTVDADKALTTTVTLTSRMFPLAWHFDRWTYDDPAALGAVQVQGRSWTLRLGGSAMEHELEVV